MDTLVQGYSTSLNEFKYNHHSILAPSNPNHVNRRGCHTHLPILSLSNGSHPVVVDSGVSSAADISEERLDFSDDVHSYTHPPSLSNGSTSVDESPSSSGVSSEGDIHAPKDEDEHDFSDEVLKYISQMLMEEEDLHNKPSMFHDCSALQAAEKSFYDVLGENYPPSPNQYPHGHGSPSDSPSKFSSVNNSMGSDRIHDLGEFDQFLEQSPLIDRTFQSNLHSFASSNNRSTVARELVDSLTSPFQTPDLVFLSRGDKGKVTPFLPMENSEYVNFDVKPKDETFTAAAAVEKSGKDHSSNGSREKKNHYREDSDYVQEGRSNKQLANYAEESEQSEMYDKVLLCPVLNPGLHDASLLHHFEGASKASNKLQQNGHSKGSNSGRPRGKKQGNRKESVVDLRSLLTQCAQAVASSNSRTVDELLKRIRQHSSAYGDGTARLAHYFADAIEARWAGTGTALYTDFTTRRISSADILKAYHLHVTACPFKKISNILANKSIMKVAEGATRLHIIDFGILYGFQWPCLIQHFSVRSGGPPKLRITGIDLPQPGFRPAERVEETGRRLANYCKRFNVPFEYNAIAKKWDTIQPEDLKIDKDEMLVVNCLYRLGNVPDETVMVNSPRDAVLNLIQTIKPDIFIHGIVNGTFNSPFFVTRFREALFHFSSMFDMFDATMTREDQDRLLFEREVFGRDAMNIIACEGTARIERPETYKQWQVRNLRAGFRQLPLYQDIMKEVSSRLKKCYHKDFVVDVDGNWMLQGWKGRVLYALSYWKPSQ